MAEEEKQETTGTINRVDEVVKTSKSITDYFEENETPESEEPTNEAPAEEGEVEEEPAPEPTPEPAEKFFDYKIEEDPRYQELLRAQQEADQLKKIVFENPEIFQQVIGHLQGEQPQPTQQPKAQIFEMPKPPQYANMEDMSDPNSETSKWFQSTLQAVAENTKNATMADVDRYIEQKFQQKEQQRAEQERQRELQNAMDSVKTAVQADDAKWQNFITWANQPGKNMNDMLQAMWKIYEETTGTKSQTPTSRTVTAPHQEKRSQAGPGLPTYSSVGGAPTGAKVMDEQEAFNEALFKNAQRFRRKTQQ